MVDLAIKEVSCHLDQANQNIGGNGGIGMFDPFAKGLIIISFPGEGLKGRKGLNGKTL